MKHTIDLAYKLISPLHISSIEESVYADPSGGGFAYLKGSNQHFPATRTFRHPVALSEAGADSGAKFGPTVPVIPSNGHRGRLRRATAEVLYDLLTARGEKLGREAYHVSKCGACKASPDSDQQKISEAFEVMSHPYVGVFGGGRRFTRSCLSVGIGWPVHPVALEAGLVPEAFREHAVAHTKRGHANFDTNWLTHNLYFTRKDDVLKFTFGVRAHIENADEAVAEWMKTISDSREKRDKTAEAVKNGTEIEGDGGSKVGLEGVAVTEVVIPGVTFHSRCYLDDTLVGMTGLGLFIHGLCRFINGGQHGGKKQVGMGRFHAAVATINGSPLISRAADGSAEPNLDTPIVAQACDAWAAYAPTVTAASLTKALLA